MDIVNKSELENIFYKLGFTNFIVNEDEEYLNQILEDENSEKIYLVDVLPNRLTEEQCSFLNTLEDYYFEKSRMESIREKWNNILIKFSCYYKLNSIFVIGTGVIGDLELYTRTVDNRGYVLKFNLEPMFDITGFIHNVDEKTSSYITFFYEDIGLIINYYFGELFMKIGILKDSKIQPFELTEIINLLRKLSESEGLFLR